MQRTVKDHSVYCPIANQLVDITGCKACQFHGGIYTDRLMCTFCDLAVEEEQFLRLARREFMKVNGEKIERWLYRCTICHLEHWMWDSEPTAVVCRRPTLIAYQRIWGAAGKS